MGPVVFRNCAAALRITESENYLDDSRVHPEFYLCASQTLPTTRSGCTPAESDLPNPTFSRL